MTFLKVGGNGISKKEDEKRLLIHLEYLKIISEAIRRKLVFDTGKSCYS